MSAFSEIWRAIVARFRTLRQSRCRHDWKREGEPFLRPGQKNWVNAEQLYRCRKCGATRQDGIF